MAGIVFLRTNDLKKIKEFYTDVLSATIWIDQQDCVIFKHDNLLFGFCQREGKIGTGWLLTFFYQTTEEVDTIYERIKPQAASIPSKNDRYNIYQFFAKDPEGRDLEFQTFLHEIDFDWNINTA